MQSDDMPQWAEDLTKKLNRLMRLTEQQNRLLNFANLGPERVVTLNHKGEGFQMYIPFANQDYIQRTILESQDFYESDMLDALKDLNIVPKGSVVIDAGSNIGNHAVYFNAFFKPARMYCFEPQQLANAALVRNMELNATGSDVRTFRAMLGAEDGTGAVSSYKGGNQGGATFAPTDGEGVPMVTLDGAIEQGDHGKVSFIKIDVEGFQAHVLRGAHKILSLRKAVLWIEVFKDEKPETDEVMALYGYTSEPLAGTRNNHIYRYTG